MSNKDLLVIGGGPGGIVASLRAAEMGLDVTIAEKERLGGVCLNRGCIPSKSLVTVADLAYYSENSNEIGLEADVKIDYGKLVEWSDGNVDKIVSGVRGMLKRAGVEVRSSKASFISSNEAEIGGETVNFKNAVIATGSVPKELPNVKFDHENIISSADFFDLKSLPEELVIIGAGYIGMELGTICAKLGCNVTIIEMLNQALPNFEDRVVRPIIQKAQELDLDIRLGLKVLEVETDEKVKVRAEDEESEEYRFSGDKCLVSIGRVPLSDGLGLENTGVTVDEKGFVETDEKFRTEDPNIYAVGDVVGGKMLAHGAYNDAVVAADTILGKESKSSSIPEVVFTDPQVAKVGKFKEDYSIGRASFRAVGAAHTKNKAVGLVQIAVDERGILKGGRIVGPHASELINELALAVENELSAEDVVRTVHVHPTVSEGIVRAAENALNLPPSGC